MTTKYLIRLDDACPTMDSVKWEKMLNILDRYEVKPMVGIIPHNEDPKLHIDGRKLEIGIKKVGLLRFTDIIIVIFLEKAELILYGIVQNLQEFRLKYNAKR